MKKVRFVGSSQDDWRALPEDVQDVLGYALHVLQSGDFPTSGKPLKGMSGIWELRDDYHTNTYRAICAMRFEDAIYVLHCFQKKSKSGIGLLRADKFIIENRLKTLEAHQAARRKKENQP